MSEKKQKKLPAYLETTEEQHARYQRKQVKMFEIGELVEVQLPGHRPERMKIQNIQHFALQNFIVVAIYELKSADASPIYATKDFLAKLE